MCRRINRLHKRFITKYTDAFKLTVSNNDTDNDWHWRFKKIEAMFDSFICLLIETKVEPNKAASIELKQILKQISFRNYDSTKIKIKVKYPKIFTQTLCDTIDEIRQSLWNKQLRNIAGYIHRISCDDYNVNRTLEYVQPTINLNCFYSGMQKSGKTIVVNFQKMVFCIPSYEFMIDHISLLELYSCVKENIDKLVSTHTEIQLPVICEINSNIPLKICYQQIIDNVKNFVEQHGDRKFDGILKIKFRDL
jgi:hypothetical protein